MSRISKHTITDWSSSYFNPVLDPQSAAKLGFTYIDDIIYEAGEMSESTLEILRSCDEFGCKLGKANQSMKGFYGVYLPKK